MKTCIYCRKSEGETTFERVEHVVPKLVGVFDGNPTLKHWVCDACNSGVFSQLETKFKEDTYEGVVYQMFNFEKKFELRILERNIKSCFVWGLGDVLFDSMFPRLTVIDGRIRPIPQAQIKINRHGEDGYIILVVDELLKLDLEGSKFKKLKKYLVGTKSSDVSVYAQAEGEDDQRYLETAFNLLKELGIEYKEGTKKFAKFDKPDHQMEMSMNVTMNNDAGRVIAKTAFNYFAYNAIQESRTDILFNPSFDSIKSYILGEANPPIKDVVLIGQDPITADGDGEKIRFIGHSLTFHEHDGNVVAEINLLGLNTYTIILGALPDDIAKENFGSGHLFDPFNHKIFSLTQNQAKWGSGAPTVFGLFNAA